MKWILATLALALAMTTGPLQAAEEAKPAAKESIGSVVALQGEATATDAAGAARKLALKAPVFREDALKTSATGRMQITFVDSTVATL